VVTVTTLNSYEGTVAGAAAAARALLEELEEPLLEVVDATRRLARPVRIEAALVLTEAVEVLLDGTAPGNEAASYEVLVKLSPVVNCLSGVAE
jgi:hypothetical protein